MNTLKEWLTHVFTVILIPITVFETGLSPGLAVSSAITRMSVDGQRSDVNDT